jgi:hypothetical protein
MTSQGYVQNILECTMNACSRQNGVHFMRERLVAWKNEAMLNTPVVACLQAKRRE